METNIKLRLSIDLQGGTLVRQSESEKIDYAIFKANYQKGKKPVYELVKKGYKKHYPLVAKPAKQVINMTETAYYYMISDECPSFSHPKKWRELNETQRLEKHLERIVSDLKGKSFTYEVLDD